MAGLSRSQLDAFCKAWKHAKEANFARSGWEGLNRKSLNYCIEIAQHIYVLGSILLAA